MLLELRSADRRFGAGLERAAAKTLASLSSSCWPLETGGILLGRYSTSLDLAIVQRALPPPRNSQQGRTWFERGTQGLQKILTESWHKPQNAREYYLGEWHSHPDGPPFPSERDRTQMQEIAESESCHCPEPILLLIAGRPRRWEVAGFVFRRNARLVELGRCSLDR